MSEPRTCEASGAGRVSTSRPYPIRNAICLHEEDYGILWKHYEFRNETFEVRRSRRLVISFFTTVGNYDYGFFWYFYQDGTVEAEVKLTGIVVTSALPAGQEPRFGRRISSELMAPNHQHFFTLRLDMMVDGQNNTVHEVHAEGALAGPDNPYGGAFI